MTHAQHTPGPWDYLKSDNSNLILIETPCGHPAGSGVHIASLAGKNNPLAEANARLIAAAPDLLEMTQLLERSLVYEINKSGRAGDEEGVNLKSLTLSTVRAAIARATTGK